MTSVSECSLTETMERMHASLSHIFACIGKCSQICTPETLVSIGLNSPRNSFGASGLRSYMSMCDGPPGRLIMIADFLRPLAGLPSAAAEARRRSMSASVRPAPNAPTWRKLRRVMPSQNFCAVLQKVNIGGTPQTKHGQGGTDSKAGTD